MNEHKVITKRERTYPFKAYWMCVCGTKMEASIMGPELYKEFAQHQGENE